MGILHGDLRPENIFITRQGEEEVVKILGFGIASARGLDKIDPATPARSLARAPHYLSPEQVRGGKGEGKRSDLWSLSVIAFRCLTGALPFDRERLGELFGAICSAKAPAPSSLAPGVGPSVDAFFRKALGRAPEERFQSARELCEALALLAGREPETLPPTLPAPPVGAGHRAPEPERTQSHAPAPKQQPVIERIALVLVVLGGVAAFAFAGFTRFHMRAPQPIRSARHLHLVVPRVSLPAPPPTTPPAALEPPPAPVVPAVPKAIPSARLAPRKSPWPSPTRRKNHGPLDDM
jgi:serine/threonine-protein kinase